MPSDELIQMLDESPFEGVTLGYCAINFPYRQLAVEAAGKKGLGVVTMNPLAGGIIPQYADRFDFLRGPDDPSAVAAALRFNVSNPAITSALVGFSSTEQVDEAVAAVEDFKPYDRSHIEALRERIGSQMNELCTGCGYCLPCPEGIPIPKFMDSYNLKLLSGKDKEATFRISTHWSLSPKDAAACSQCGQCEQRCTQHLPIRDRLEELAKMES